MRNTVSRYLGLKKDGTVQIVHYVSERRNEITMLLKYFDVQYKVERGQPYAYLFCRDSKGKRKIVKIPHRPYFYVPIDPKDDDILLPIEKVRKIEVSVPSEVAKVRDAMIQVPVEQPDGSISYVLKKKYPRTYESDILFPLRVIIDRSLYPTFELGKDNKVYMTDKVLDIPPRKWYIDIEFPVDEDEEMGDPWDAEKPIQCFTIYDSYDKKYYEFQYDEKDMLMDLIKLIREKDPDILLAWNIDFDLTGIMRRMEKLGISTRNLSMTYVSRIFRDEKSKDFTGEKNPIFNRVHIQMHGRGIIDLLKTYKNYKHREFESYNLTYIAKVEEKLKDTENVPLDTDYYYMTKHPEEYMKLNKSHVRYTVELDEKYHLIDVLEMERVITGCRYREVDFITRATDVYLLRKFHGKYVVARKPKGGRPRLKFEGAFVLDPKTGVYRNVVMLDFSGMYPSIISSFNMSPETFRKTKEDDCYEVYYTMQNSHEKRTCYFKKYPKGVIPELIEMLTVRRKKVKDEMKQMEETEEWHNKWALQFALKKLIASIFGTFSSPNFRFYCPEISAVTCYVGRQMIHRVINKAKELGYTSILCDTDSILIELSPEDDPVEKGKEITKIINDDLRKFAEETDTGVMNVKFEKVYSVFIPVKKKRYIGMVSWEDHPQHELDVKGFQAKRSDAPRLSREIQKKIFTLILDNIDKGEELEDNIDDFIERIKRNIKDYPLEEISIPRKIKKPINSYAPSHQAGLRGMIYMERKYNRHFKIGERFYLIPVKSHEKMELNGQLYPIDTIAFNANNPLPDEWKDRIDWKTIIEKIIYTKVEDLLKVIGVSVGPQTTLFNWERKKRKAKQNA